MSILLEEIQKAGTIAIGGHVRPDGDCIGSCMGLYSYIQENYPDKKLRVFLEEIPEAFEYLNRKEALEGSTDQYDLFVSLDCGSPDRLGGIFRRRHFIPGSFMTPECLNIPTRGCPRWRWRED